jgi:peptide methionine sulfoxide reductase MsrB
VQETLRWDCDKETADRICCFNRHYAEYSGYWESTPFLNEARISKDLTFYDSVTGKPLFVAPRQRSFEDFVHESRHHGWPSFRDAEVVWDNVRSLSNGEIVSTDGTHLGHNLPDRHGNRYCINLVCIAGFPAKAT